MTDEEMRDALERAVSGWSVAYEEKLPPRTLIDALLSEVRKIAAGPLRAAADTYDAGTTVGMIRGQLVDDLRARADALDPG